MKTKKYWIWVIVSFSILVVLCPAQRITGETGLSAKGKKTITSKELFSAPGETSQSAKDKENDSNLTALAKIAFSARAVPSDEKAVLEGLEGVKVLVEEIRPEAKKYRLTEKALQTDTELQLRQYGIKVLTEEEWLSTPGRPTLYINANVVMHEETYTFAAAIRVELHEWVLLLREPVSLCVGSTTWHRGSVGFVGLHRIKDIREAVKDKVNEFINDYLAANPKDHSTKKKGGVFDDLKKPKDN